MVKPLNVLALFVALLLVRDVAAIGVNLGLVADNLPTPDAIRQLVQTTTLTKVKLFDSNPAFLTAFANSGIDVVIGAGNDLIAPFATQSGSALQWIQTNVAAYPNTSIVGIALGNEVLAYASDQATSLLPAMKNLHAALATLKLDAKVKVSTPSALSVLGSSSPPSNGTFRDWEGSILTPILGFLNQTNSPFMVNLYPYFAYVSDPQHISLNFCIFQPNATETRFDNATGLTYTSMWDAQLDAVYAALARVGYPNVSVAVTEVGWPSAGDMYEVGPSLDDAHIFNGNLVKHIDSNVGTPLRPGKSVETYIFSLFNENLKPGQGSEKNFGLFYPNMTAVYDVNITKSSVTSR